MTSSREGNLMSGEISTSAHQHILQDSYTTTIHKKVQTEDAVFSGDDAIYSRACNIFKILIFK